MAGVKQFLPRAVRVRASAAALLGMFVFAQAASVWHEATAEHAICPEHGEVIDVGAPDFRSAGAPERPAVPAIALADGAELSSHGHCTLLAHHREQRPLPPPTDLPGVVVEATPERIGVARGAPADATAILFVAPKASPPA